MKNCRFYFFPLLYICLLYVAVACGARLSCSVFMVYSYYCSWHLWRALPYKRCAYSVHMIGGKPAYIESGARSHIAVSIL